MLTDLFGWVGATIDDQLAVESVVGEGAFGLVYRGVHLGFDAPVAIKCLKLPAEIEPSRRDDLVEAFRREAKILYRLSRRTPAVVQPLSVGAAVSPRGAWTPYLAMEWLEGRTLAEEIRARRAAGAGPYGLEEAIELLGPAALAIAEAHRERVSHRDVKPENLFLVQGGGPAPIKVLDFGVAKVLSESIGLTEALARTDRAFAAFTPLYGAPEQFSQRFGATGPWTDVYAIALVLVELVIGRPALRGSDALQLFMASSDERQRPTLAHHGATAPAAIEEVLQCALAVRPALRYRDAGELWEALGAARAAKVAAVPGGSAPAGDAAARWAPAMGEHRVCTVLAVDLGEIVAQAGKVDPEAVNDLVERCFEAVREEAEALGGFVERSAKERPMVLFGVPRAQDNDAERAVTAALRARDAIARQRAPRALRAARDAARMGIASGRVFVTRGAGAGEIRAIGDATGAAAALVSAAPPGAVAVGRETYREVEALFQFAPPDPARPERSETATARIVIAALPYRRAFTPPSFCGRETRFVGRASERQRLADALETALSEARPVRAVVVGSAGLGKSRLLAEVLSGLGAREEPVLAWAVRASALASDTGYGLFAALLGAAFDVQNTDRADIAREKLARGAARLLFAKDAETGRTGTGRAGAEGTPRASEEPSPADFDDTIAQAAEVFGARGAADASDAGVRDDAASQAKARVAAAVARLCGWIASRRPLALFCDDVQWADDASLDLLDELAVRLAEHPVLIVTAARPDIEERRPGFGDLGPEHARVELGPLPRRHLEEIVRDRLHGAADLPASMVKELVERADGNPRILDETLSLLVDAGVVETSEQGPWTVRTERLGSIALPATVQGAVQARLDRLPPEERRVLSIAAVIGRQLWDGAVARLVSISGAQLDEAEVARILASLGERRLVRAASPSSIAGERARMFVEAATWEVACEMLPLRARRPLHLAAAEWLEPRLQGASSAALLAHHFQLGGDARRAAAAHLRAASHAMRLGEHEEALRHLGSAQAIHDEAEGEETMDAADAGPAAHAAGIGAGDTQRSGLATAPHDRRIAAWVERVRLRLDRSDALRRAGRLDEAVAACEEARARILRAERRRDGALSAREIAKWEGRCDLRRALVHRVRGEIDAAREHIERAIASATEAGATDEIPAMYGQLAILHRRARRLDESWSAARRGLAVCRTIERRDTRAREDAAQLLNAMGICLYSKGQHVRAERLCRQALRAVDETESPYIAGIALNGIAAARFARGDLAAARDVFLRSLRPKERWGDLHQIAIVHSNLAEVELSLGDTAAALSHAEKAVRIGEQVRAGLDLADMYRNLGMARLAAGDLGGALAAGNKALGSAARSGRVYLGEAAFALARIAARAFESAPPGSALRGEAVEAARAIEAALSQHASEAGVMKRAEECRGLIGPLLGG